MRSGVLQKAINQYKFDIAETGTYIRSVLVGFSRRKQTLSRVDLIVASPTYVSEEIEARHWDHTRRVIHAANDESDGAWLST